MTTPDTVIRFLQGALRSVGMCPDGGKCHHHCSVDKPCRRQDGCVPLSGSGLRDDWSVPGSTDWAAGYKHGLWQAKHCAAGPLPATQSVDAQRQCEWTNCPTRVGNVCCNDRAEAQRVALTDEQIAALTIMLDHFGRDPRTECLRPLVYGITEGAAK